MSKPIKSKVALSEKFYSALEDHYLSKVNGALEYKAELEEIQEHLKRISRIQTELKGLEGKLDDVEGRVDKAIIHYDAVRNQHYSPLQALKDTLRVYASKPLASNVMALTSKKKVA